VCLSAAAGCLFCQKQRKQYRTRCGAAAVAAEEATTPAHEANEQGMGPAALATLRMLEWPRLCAHIARFTSTTLGRQAALELQVSTTFALAFAHATLSSPSTGRAARSLHSAVQRPEEFECVFLADLSSLPMSTISCVIPASCVRSRGSTGEHIRCHNCERASVLALPLPSALPKC